MQHVDLCWMYCPDDVVMKLYAFLKTVNTNSSTDDQKAAVLEKAMVAIRNDLL